MRPLCLGVGVLPSESFATISSTFCSLLSLLGRRDSGPSPPWVRAEYLQEIDRLSLESMTYVSSVMFRAGGVME